MKESYDVAVIGESMSGKSTLISSMFAEEVADALVEVCKKNESGQTKLPVHYSVLEEKQPLRVDAIGWNLEELAYCLKKKQGGALAEMLGKFGFLHTLADDGQTEEDFLKGLNEYLESEPYKEYISVMDCGMLMDFINDREICDANLVSCVELSGGANEEIRKIMCKKGVKHLKFRDTKGFLDESPEKMQQAFEKDAEFRGKKAEGMLNVTQKSTSEKVKKYVDRQLKGRGLCGKLDACIFLSISGSNSLHKEICRDIYGEVLSSLISSQPTALVIRDSSMTDALYLKEAEMDVDRMVQEYNNALGSIMSRLTFTGFDSFQILVDGYVIKQEKVYMTELLKKNQKKYILADISAKMQHDSMEIGRRIYRQSIVGMVANLLDDMESYDNSIEAAKKCEEKLGKCEKGVFERIFVKLFNKDIAWFEKGYGLQQYSSYYAWYIESLIKNSPYQGGMVGERGGLTTRRDGRMVGKVAIDLMEGAYQIRKDVFEQYIRENEPEVKKIMGDMVSEEAVKDMMANIYMLYQRRLHWKSESLYCTGPMVSRHYLENAYYKVKKLLEMKNSEVEEFLSEQKPGHIKGHEEEWQRDCRSVMTLKLLLYFTAKCE